MGDESSCAIGKQEKAPRTPDYTPRTTDYTPPCSPMHVPKSPSYSPTYAPAFCPPEHTQLCKVNGMPVTTVATSIWDGERSPDDDHKHKFSPKSAPC